VARWRLQRPARHLLFRDSELAAAQDARLLAEECSQFGGDFRVVAFSLGCRLALEALPLLPPDLRPREVHLCAAAVTERFARPHLPHACSPEGRVFHYFSSSDEVLNTGFRLLSQGDPALGSAPLAQSLPNVTSHDASNYCGVLVHDSYGSAFDRMASDALQGREPPVVEGEWLQRQRAQLQSSVSAALGRLPSAPTARLGRLPSAPTAREIIDTVQAWLQERVPRFGR